MKFEDDASDPYTVLGLSPRTPWPQIRVRFRELVKGCHPDLGPDDGRSERFLRIMGAYRTLERVLDAEARAVEPQRASVAEPRRPARKTAELLAASHERLSAGGFKAAETLSRLAIKDNPRSPDAYVSLARALLRQDLFVEANGCLRMALQLDPQHTSAGSELLALQRRDRVTG